MAQFLGNIATAFAAGLGPNTWKTAGFDNGRVKCNVDFYVGLGTEVAGSTLLLGTPLPVGAMILRRELTISASIGSFAVSVGDQALATRFGTALPLATLNTVVTVPGLSGGGPYIVGTNPGSGVPNITSDRNLVLTTSGATLTSGTAIMVVTYFTTD